MNAIQTNDFTHALDGLGKTLQRPRSIVCISAHWMTDGLWVTHMPNPRTIHDFGGFPQELFDLRYPAPGSPETAKLIGSTLKDLPVNYDDHSWGLDHGSWAVLKFLYPQANIPVVQLSVNMAVPKTQQGQYHLELGAKLRSLRDQGVLIVGSGNVVHNLRKIDWETSAKPYDWSLEFDEWVKKKIIDRDFKSLARDFESSEAGRLSVPTSDHYLPLLVVLGAAARQDEVSFIYEGFQNASISMRSVILARP